MNKRKTIAITLLICLLAAGVIFFNNRAAKNVQGRFEPEQLVEAETEVAYTGKSDSAGPPPLDDEGVVKPLNVAEADWQRFLRMHAARKASNRRVRFYGRVIDQNGDPVQGMVISCRVLRRETSLAKIVADGKDQIKDDFELTTDQSGNFTVEERSGGSLKFEKFRKEGYIFPSHGVNTLFMFGQLLRNPASSEFHHPDPTNPVIFNMWKKGETEPLIAMGMVLDFLEKEGTNTLYLPLVLKGKAQPHPVEDWDIKAKVMVQSRKDWSFTLEGNEDCGLIVTQDIHTNLAPEDGYVPSITVSSDDPDVRPDVNRSIKVYYRGRNGKKYAAFRMEFGAYGQRGENNFVIYLRGLRINPNGSRNLEFDKSKQIK